MNFQKYCAHGVSINKECLACAVMYRIEKRRENREKGLRDSLSECRALLDVYCQGGIVLRDALTKTIKGIDAALTARGDE